MTIRETPSPSWRAMENPPLRFLAGSVAGVGGAIGVRSPIGADADADLALSSLWRDSGAADAAASLASTSNVVAREGIAGSWRSHSVVRRRAGSGADVGSRRTSAMTLGAGVAATI